MSSCGVTLPTVTLGQDGLRFMVEQQLWSARYDISNARIFVGAGDACMAGFAVGFARDFTALTDIACYGVAVASVHVEGADPKFFAAEVEKIKSSVKLQLIQ